MYVGFLVSSPSLRRSLRIALLTAPGLLLRSPQTRRCRASKVVAPPASRERVQQPVLGHGEAHWAPGRAHPALGPVDLERADPERPGRGAPAECEPDPRHCECKLLLLTGPPAVRRGPRTRTCFRP